MVRSKGSSTSLQAAASIANAISTWSDPDEKAPPILVHYKGPQSIFAAIRSALPSVVRTRGEDGLHHRFAVSELDLSLSITTLLTASR